ncbi:hypothetical protein AHAS_Ahas01G0252500 [Arachis hypogaea]
MEGGPEAVSKQEFTEFWKRATSSPYIMRLALSAGIGGLLFGYDTGVISGALLYIREDFVEVDKKLWLQEVIVSMAVAGAIIGAALGGWMNDMLGRKTSILGADIVFFIGAIVMAIAPAPWVLVVGRILFVLMLTLPESPRWLYNQGKENESRKILEKIYRADEIEGEIKAMREAVEQEKQEEGLIGQTLGEKMKAAFSNVAVRRGLYAGVTAQVAQQFVGINTVMYYSPTIVQFAGIASKSTALALSLVTSGLNAVGSILSMLCIDKYGRRKLMLLSLIAIIICLLTLTGVFYQAATTAPPIDNVDTLSFGANATCQAYLDAPNVSSWNCMKCLKAECAFCASTGGNHLPGACLAETKEVRAVCGEQKRVWFSDGCPSKIGVLAVIVLGLYILAYSPGMGSVPWVLNSEIYPLRFRGIGGGIAAVSNWCANLIVSLTFLSLIHALGAAGTFLLFAGFSTIGLVAIYLLVPETKGLQFEEVEKLLQKGFNPCGCTNPKTDEEKASTSN